MNQQICLVPRLTGLGGTSSFQVKFTQGLESRHVPYTFDLDQPDNAAILVIGGTRQLFRLWRAKRRGVRIVQRLDGLNWLHKVEKTPTKAALRAEINNRILAFIRRHLADDIIYQSEFSRTWWSRVFGEQNLPNQVVYNGVDLEAYSPEGPGTPPSDHIRILLVEGNLTGANARGLETAVRLTHALDEQETLPLELMVVGVVSEGIKARIQKSNPDLWITWGGVVPREGIPAVDRSAHLLFSADLNAACPNSVIEALACGLPVAAYDTGALSEIVQPGSGEVVPYGADYWQLENPHIQPLADACSKILHQNQSYRQQARSRAESAFSLDEMVESYLEVLQP